MTTTIIDINLNDIWPLLNQKMLLVKHLGLKSCDLKEGPSVRATKLISQIEQIKKQYSALLISRGVYQIFDQYAVFVVAMDKCGIDQANQLKNDGEYTASHILYSLILELAEASAEYLHQLIAKLWNVDYQSTTRLSPGYPACPNLDDQKKIFELLQPEKIGVTLTDGMMMDPEAAVSAYVYKTK